MRLAVLSAVAALRETLFPPGCPTCGAETGAARTLCANCWRDMAFLDARGCRRCSRPVPGLAPEDPDPICPICDECLRHPPAWDRGRAAFRYEGPGRRLVLGLKHGDRLDTVPMLGAWALRAGRDLVDAADLIAPVPLHWTRRLKRRANQSAELARWLTRAAGKPAAFAPRLLLRPRRTASQDGKDRVARAANLEGALCLGPQAARLDGARVLLVDDVLTTGATLNEATRLCRAGGASGIDVLVLALVVRDEFAYVRPAVEPEDRRANAEAD